MKINITLMDKDFNTLKNLSLENSTLFSQLTKEEIDSVLSKGLFFIHQELTSALMSKEKQSKHLDELLTNPNAHTKGN